MAGPCTKANKQMPSTQLNWFLSKQSTNQSLQQEHGPQQAQKIAAAAAGVVYSHQLKQQYPIKASPIFVKHIGSQDSCGKHKLIKHQMWLVGIIEQNRTGKEAFLISNIKIAAKLAKERRRIKIKAFLNKISSPLTNPSGFTTKLIRIIEQNVGIIKRSTCLFPLEPLVHYPTAHPRWWRAYAVIIS